MFVADADMACLRQGDILKNIPYPLLDTAELRIIGRPPEGDPWDPKSFSAEAITIRDSPAYLGQALMRVGFAAVISQCCDIAPRNGKINQSAIALARLIPIPPGPRKDGTKMESLVANK